MANICHRAPIARRVYGTVFVLFVVLGSVPTSAHAVQPSQRTDSTYSLSPATAPPAAVADLIGMTVIDLDTQNRPNADYDVVSPDGSRIATVVQRGNLARNTVDFTLLVFRTSDLLRAPRPDTVATFASSSNRPGIVNLRWSPDNTTLAFIGEQPGTTPQVYTVDTRTHAVSQRTHAATAITMFDMARSGDQIIYAALAPHDTAGYAAMRAHGFVLDPRQFVFDVIEGNWGQIPTWMLNNFARTLHVVSDGVERAVPVPDSTLGYRGCDFSFETGQLAIAPTGDAAIVHCDPRQTPPEWKNYRRRISNDGLTPPTYVVIDLRTGLAHPLLGTPVSLVTGPTLVWAPDGRTVVVGSALLPLNAASATERAARAEHAMLAEVDVRTGAITVIAHQDSLAVVRWDERSSTIETVPVNGYSVRGATERVYYRKTARGWRRVRAPTSGATDVPALKIDEGMNTPERLVAVDPRTRASRVVYDPNPGLLAAHRFGRETVIHWKAKTGVAWAGGLYWPPDYVRGRRYPLVIQTHGFDSTAFWPSGVFTTGAAAQPLANQGIMVLQTINPPSSVMLTPREGPTWTDGVEAAIDHLDSLGLIDRTKIGMQGFSRTCYHTLYFLTHSPYRLAAATATDGIDFSYLSYTTAWGQIWTSLNVDGERVNGGRPFGSPLTQWREQAPGFNLDRVTAPLQLTAESDGGSLLGEWEPYAGLLLQGKPTEMVFLPDAAHAVVKPWERMTSQQGAVDWYRFWLQGYEDPDPTKAGQYVRWRHLRAMRDSSAAVAVQPH